jgi:hypothetical protein
MITPSGPNLTQGLTSGLISSSREQRSLHRDRKQLSLAEQFAKPVRAPFAFAPGGRTTPLLASRIVTVVLAADGQPPAVNTEFDTSIVVVLHPSDRSFWPPIISPRRLRIELPVATSHVLTVLSRLPTPIVFRRAECQARGSGLDAFAV